jgi:molecular chaperone GrpE
MTDTKPNSQADSSAPSPEETAPASTDSTTTDGSLEEIKSLNEKVATLTAKIADFEDLAKRQQAEFENYRRRVNKEREELLKYSASDVLKDLLPIVDNFDRALSANATDDAAGHKALKEGVQMIHSSLYDLLKKHYVQETGGVGTPFQPDLHLAIGSEEAQDVDTETVHEVYQKGYRHHERVLRVATVKVVKPANKENSSN